MSRRTIFGFHAVLAKLRHDPEAIHEVYLDAERKDARARDLIRHAENAGVKLMPVDGKRLESMAPGARHQGVVAHVSAQQRHVTLDLFPDVENLATAKGTDVVDAFQQHGILEASTDGAGVVVD